MHSEKVREENKQLRSELLELFATNRGLREREAMLKAQNKDLVRQGELNMDVSEQQVSRMTRRLSRTFGSTARFSLV